MSLDVSNTLKQILKPLTIIMCVAVFTWPFIILVNGIIRQYISTENSLTISLYMIWVTEAGRASDYFIFFAFRYFYYFFTPTI
jgi:hypothetical protein